MLKSLGSSVDVVRPGLEIADDAVTRLGFSESQDNGNHVPLISPAEFQHITVSRSSTSRRSATSGSAFRQVASSSVRGKAMGRTPKAKLRHEDSQVQFAVVDSSPALNPQESQLLTDRQKEVRERQHDTAVMFPALRSSTSKTRSKKTQEQVVPSRLSRGATPEQAREFDDCLASTPTPRRGQSALLPEPDNEMLSSPPEPRSFRSLVELKSRTTNSVAMDDWHLSSSPISGSPNPAAQASSVPQAMGLDDVDEQLDLNGKVDVIEIPKAAERGVLPVRPEMIDEASVSGEPEGAEPRVAADPKTAKLLQSTPSGRKSCSNRTQMTPDDEEFMDACSSPMRPTPSQKFATAVSMPAIDYPVLVNSKSSNPSGFFERGVENVSTATFEIALRSSQLKKEYAAYDDILPVSPAEVEELMALESSQFQDAVEVFDTIEVAGADGAKQRRSRSKKARIGSASQTSRPSQHPFLNAQLSQESQAQRPSTPIEQPLLTQGNFQNVSPGNGRWWRKRKQSISSDFSSGSKRPRFEDVLAAESIQEEIPDSQPSPDVAAGNEGMSLLLIRASASLNSRLMATKDPPVEIQSAQEPSQDDVSSMADEDATFAEHTIASQELPSAAEEEPNLVSQLALPSLPDDEPVHESGPALEVDAPQDHTDYMNEDMTDDTDDEEAVHSQLREETESASRAASPSRALLDEEEDMPQVVAEQDVAHALPSQQEESSAMEEPERQPAPAACQFDDLMGTFRRGMDIVRATDLSREQFYQVEDMMFAMREELLQSMRRGDIERQT